MGHRLPPVRVAPRCRRTGGPVGALIGEQLGYLRPFESLVRAEMGDSATLPEGAAVRIRAATEARFPGYPRVAPQRNLIERNAEALARESARR
ncbi:hypothetical protein [Neoroseomonas rubea]|uniref:hypothetical protein n=1 Tax=Neoroseomonas rubea TaxID=2748666 RepID=UPI0018E0559B|nr:hypothetical protein [Roseomonas rubea]